MRRAEVVKKLPNVLTIARLAMAAPFFVLLAVPRVPHAYDVALALFVLAGLTDAVDGWIARRFDAKSVLGRILDPAADKVLVCGAFVFFAAAPWHVPAWVAVVVLARELTVSGLRGVAEALGTAYPGSVWGKVKMFVQSLTIVYLLIYAGHLLPLPAGEGAGGGASPAAWAECLRHGFVWATVVATSVSGIQHLFRSLPLIRGAERPAVR